MTEKELICETSRERNKVLEIGRGAQIIASAFGEAGLPVTY